MLVKNFALRQKNNCQARFNTYVLNHHGWRMDILFLNTDSIQYHHQSPYINCLKPHATNTAVINFQVCPFQLEKRVRN